MRRKQNRYLKTVLSSVLVLIMLFNVAVVPAGAVTELLSNEHSSTETVTEVTKPPSSLDGITIPSVGNNPYDVDVSVDVYPVYSSEVYNRLDSRYFASYGVHEYKVDGQSAYYTAAITPWFDYEEWIDRDDNMTITTDLPYREGREGILGDSSQMLHSELVLTNGGIMTRLINDLGNIGYRGTFKEILSDYLGGTLGLRTDQLYVKVSATLISGNGGIRTTTASGNSYSANGRVTDGEPQQLSISIPLNEIDVWTTIYFDVDNGVKGTTHAMTDFNITLIDDTAPSVQHIELKREVREDNSADLILEMTFNEKVRFAGEGVKNELDNLWVELELVDLSNNKKDTARLYLQGRDGGKWIFRGDIGLYNYKDFRVNRITKASFALCNRGVAYAVVDLADEMCVSAYDTVDYDNRIIAMQSLDYVYRNTTAICDLAGNGINVSSITNWSFGDQSYISNTFEAVEVELYNTNVVELREDQGEIKNTSLTDMLVGPLGSITAYVYIDQELTEDEAKKVYVEFNILNPDGTPLKARATKITKYEKETPEGIRKGWILIFENIPLSQGMKLDVTESVGTEPKIIITNMFDEIDGKTAYPNVVEPSNILYADFNSPVVTISKFAEREEQLEDGSKKHFVSVSLSLTDEKSYMYVAGLRGVMAHVSIGGGVIGEATVKYVVSDNAVPPENESEYTETLTLCENEMVKVDSFGVADEVTDKYLHLYFENGEVYVDDIFVAVDVCDIVGNSAVIEKPDTIDYLIDGVAPTVRFTEQTTTPIDGNTALELKLNVNAVDNSKITSVLYCIGADTESAEWKVLEITAGNEINEVITIRYGGNGDEGNKIYNDTVWVKAVDEHGNESKPAAKHVSVSLEKPSTNAKYEGDLNEVSTYHKIMVTGPAASQAGVDAYTRVTVTPDGSEYSYVTIVKTGEVADILGFEGLYWYRVKLGVDKYIEVSAPELIEKGYTLSNGSVLYELFKYYGELKISFDNGYGDMTPRAGEYFSDAANAGSYAKDSTYYVVRYASPYDTERTVYNVDFGEIIDKDGKVVVANADKGNTPYKFNAVSKGVNPMRRTQIHYTLTNMLRSDFALLDFDWENSYAELIWTGENGEEQIIVVTQNGLFASASQFFSIGNLTDSDEFYKTGAYYLRVTVKSKSGATDVYESSRLVLDAETADNSGLWSYSYQTKADITSLDEEKGYSWVRHDAENEAYTTIGVSAMVGGEKMRSNVFAVYSYGVSGLSITLKMPDEGKTYEGIKVGGVVGFKMWNMLSEPTAEEINAQSFVKDYEDSLIKIVDTDEIYNLENIPKGVDGFRDLYLVKGVNTICYQVKMENGYVSPTRQFTIIVTDYSPELNIAIDDYKPSHKVSQIDGVVNAHSIRFFVETAYSMNGSGNVSVDLWSRYKMNVGEYGDDGILTETVYGADSVYNDLEVVKKGLGVEDFADFTENSYTSDFPRYSSLCTAVFVATDEYGAVTIVAPQIGDNQRCDVSGGVAYYNEYNIDYYGTYFDDPYTVGDSFTSWRIAYNQPVYFGKDLLSFDNYLYENTEDGDSLYETLMVSNPELKYNLFNIVTNDIEWGAVNTTSSLGNSCAIVSFSNGNNFDLIRWEDATITFTGGDLGEKEVTVPLMGGGENAAGYDRAHADSTSLTFYVSHLKETPSNPVGTTVTRSYRIECFNIYGDRYEKSGTVELCYKEYTITHVTMSESGVSLRFSFETLEHGISVRTGIFGVGEYTIDVTDIYGNKETLKYAVSESDSKDPNTEIKFSSVEDTSMPVIVELKRSDSVNLFADINDYAIMSVENNGTSTVRVTVTKNTRFSYRYRDSNGQEKMYYITVDNIKEPSPYLIWSYDTEEYNQAEDGTKYRYGSVTVYLTDNEFGLVDKYTGKMPSFTFVPGGESSYVFKKEDIIAVLGDETVSVDMDIAVNLDVKLYEPPSPLGKESVDAETPNVQILAFSNLNGVYSEEKLSVQLENARNSTALNNYSGYTVFEYTGDRADMTRALETLGWSTSYRFVIETVDMSRVRIFIKEGLYSEAPDYETGVSDVIDGVVLNSRLLTVSQKAEFSLFVVDDQNNSSSISFKVDNVGAAPSPSIVKVPFGSELVKAYILMPDGAEEVDFLGSDIVKIESDTDSIYYGKPYVEYSSNDEYIVNYKMLWNGEEVISSIAISVSEIILTEMALKGNGVEWSSNNTFETTNKDVTAVVYFTENVKELFVYGDYDRKVVNFVITGNTVTVTYSANHPEITLEGVAENGTSATVRLGAVSVIDKNAPTLDIVSRELAKNGRSIKITVSSNERVITKVGGYGAEERDGMYYYTVTYTENGEYSLEFVDMTGLSSGITIEVTEIVTEELAVEYSLSPDGAEPFDDLFEIQITVGDRIYVNPHRDVIAELSGGTTIELACGEWTEIAVPDIYGGIQPYIVFTDEYGNVLTHQFSKIDVPDTTGPEIVINKRVLTVREGTDRETIQRELMGNFNAFDDESENIELSVRFTEKIDEIGISIVEYVATDEAGNVTVCDGKLRIVSFYEPFVVYGEQKLSRDEGIVVSKDEELVLSVDCQGLYYKAILKSGDNTAAQMKYGSSIISDYTLDGELDIGKLDAGTYTLFIINQNRDYFKIIIVVSAE